MFEFSVTVTHGAFPYQAESVTESVTERGHSLKASKVLQGAACLVYLEQVYLYKICWSNKAGQISASGRPQDSL